MKYVAAVLGFGVLVAAVLLLWHTINLDQAASRPVNQPTIALEMVKLYAPTTTPTPETPTLTASPLPTGTPTSTQTPSPTPKRIASQTPIPTLATAFSSNNRIYWGASIGGLSPSSQNMQPGGPIDVFEQNAKKRMSIIHWGQPWVKDGVLQVFPRSSLDNVRAHGSIPMVTWGSWVNRAGADQPLYQNRKISAGAYDAFIRQWAAAAKAWGHPFFLRFDWEMNGWWNPWGEGQITPGGPIVNGNSAGDFVKMWQHVHDIFQQVGATNVSWVWCINHEGPSQYPPLSQIYPGDSYVDWTCVDGYNKYFPPTWINFNQILTGAGTDWLINSYQAILDVAPGKPMMIGEIASVEYGDGGSKKAEWISDALTDQMIYNFPQIKALVWYEWNERNPSLTYTIESSAPSQKAFASGIGLPNYMPNNYATLNLSPIPSP